MKQFLPISMLLLLIGTTYASTDESMTSEDIMCVQMTQAAVGLDGKCQEFPTPCDVPADWKQVSSCEMVKDKNFGTSLESRMQKRASSIRNGVNSQKKAKKSTANSGKRGIKRMRATRTDNATKKTGSTRTFTKKNYSQASRDRIKSLNTNKGGYQQEGDTTSAERKERRQNKRKIMSSVSTVRTGKLSNEPKWSTQVEKRNKTTTALKNWKLSHINEARKAKRKARKERIYEGPTLQKVYKGDRIQGDLGGNTETTDNEE